LHPWLASVFPLLAVPAFCAAPTFTKDVLPILQQHCQSCHRPGQIAPMPLLTYPETRPWAKAIRDAVLTRKMPPWFADREYGHFSNDPSLTRAEIDTLAAWANSGAAPGSAGDAPPPRTWPQGWSIGRPDAVFDMPARFAIPERGTIEYQYLIVPTGFTGDKWINRIEVRPLDPSVVHHAVVYVREPGSGWLEGEPRGQVFELPATPDHQPNPRSFTTSDILMVYTPGNSTEIWGPGIAKKVKAGSDLVLQIHYTANGKARSDRISVGVIFANEPPRQAALTLQMGNDRFTIPPGDADYRVSATGTLPNDALLVGLLPHMHLRGKSFEFDFDKGRGEIETLLKVSNYDFHWQMDYRLAEPLPLRAGTRLLWVAHYDNSPHNPRNPDPRAEVRFGEQSWQEMMIGFFEVLVDPRLDKQNFFVRAH
jgi:hypothetical protein